MKKLYLLIFSVILVLFLIAIPALAEPSHQGDEAPDVWCYVPTKVVESPVGGAVLVKIRDDGYWTGTFQIAEGKPTKEFGFTVVYPQDPEDPQSVRLVWSGTVFFPKVTVNGRTGRLWMRAFSVKEPFAEEWQGTWVIIHGAGELAGIQGHGTVGGPGWTGEPVDCGNGYSGGLATYTVEDLVFPDD